ncbi:MAG: gliding motility-associated C-terminal domain-containing protein [Paludibacteraceae bacterium]|nr:gliding motility-associated C-terminal domain-containing protein [Paludibacteraceae bacterium]
MSALVKSFSSKVCANFALLFAASLFSTISVNAALKNHPISYLGDKSTMLYATTFSIADNEEPTTDETFELSDVYNYGGSSIKFNEKFAEGETDIQGFKSNMPHANQYIIVSDPHVLEKSAAYPYEQKIDEVNRLIINTVDCRPGLRMRIFEIPLTNCVPKTTVRIQFDLEWVRSSTNCNDNADAWFALFENDENHSIANKYLNLGIEGGAAKQRIHYDYTFTPTAATTTLRFIKTDGCPMAIAISNIVITGEVADISISCQSESMFLGTPVTLNASLKSASEEEIVWYRSVNNATNWQQIASGSKTYVDNPGEVGVYYYKATIPGVDEPISSNIVSISRIIQCDASVEGSHMMFTDDFGQLGSEQARDSSLFVINGYKDPVNGFKYRPACKAIKGKGANDYAIVANPHWAGCHDQWPEAPGDNSCDCKDGFWFDQRYDHTQNGMDKDGKFGGMLFLNPQDNEGSGIMVYSREAECISRNTNVNFSAWFANAAIFSGEVKCLINAELRVKGENGEYIPEATLHIKDIMAGADWTNAVTSFNTGNNTKLTVEIWNMTYGDDKGNDLLIDDIAFWSCPPYGTLEVEVPPVGKFAVTDSTVTGKCGSEVKLKVIGESIEKLDNPYFMWLYKTGEMTKFEKHPTFASLPAQNITLGTDTMFKVIVAGSKEDAEAYFEGTLPKECLLASETNYMTSFCRPVNVSFSRNCNTLTFTSTCDADWYKAKSIDEPVEWVKINEEGPVSRLKLELEEPYKYYKAVGEFGDESEIIKMEAYMDMHIQLYANSDPTNIKVGGETIAIQNGESVFIGLKEHKVGESYRIFAKYENSTLIDVVGDVAPVDETPFWKEHTPIYDVAYYIERQGCTSDTVYAKIAGGILLVESTRNCNDVTLHAETEMSEVKWYSKSVGAEEWNGPLTDETGAVITEKDITVSATSDSIFKATTEYLGKDFSSNSDTILYYHAELLGAEIDDMKWVNDTIFTQIGSDIKLKVKDDSYASDKATYIITNKAGEEFSIDQKFIATDSITIENVTANDEYSLTAKGCEFNSVVLVVKDTVYIPDDPDDPRSETAIVRNNCNNITITADASTNDVYWFSSTDNTNWTPMEGGSVIGKVLETTITANTFFKAGVKVVSRGKADDMSYSNSVKVEFYHIEQIGNVKDSIPYVNDTIFAKIGDTVVLGKTVESYAGPDAIYEFTDKDGTELGKITPEDAADKMIEVQDVQENNVFTMKVDECVANPIVLVVQDTTHIPVDPDDPRWATTMIRENCNDITITADASTDEVYWFSSADSTNWSPMEGGSIIGKEMKTTITENTFFKTGVKVRERGMKESVFHYSNVVKAEFFHIEQIGNVKGVTPFVTDTIFAELNDTIILGKSTDSYTGDYLSYKFFDSEGNMVGSFCACEDSTIEIIAIHDETYIMKAADCVSNPIVLVVQDTIYIPVDPDDPRSATAVVRNNCNDITITADASTDEVYWFSSADGTTWSPMEGGSVIGKVLTTTITENTYFKAAVKVKERDKGTTLHYSNAVYLEYYKLNITAYPADNISAEGKTIIVTYNSNAVIRLSDDSYAGADADYAIYNKNGEKIGSFDVKGGVRTFNVNNITEDQTYYVKVDECVSDVVNIVVNATVDILITERSCNHVTLTAKVSGTGDVVWMKEVNGVWVEMTEKGNTINIDLTDNIKIKAVIGIFESEPITIDYYGVELNAINILTGETGKELNIGIGAKVDLEPTVIGVPESENYVYYDSKGNVVGNTTADDPNLTVAPSVNQKYGVMVSGCKSNMVKVNVEWPTVFTPLNVDGYNDDFLMNVDPAIKIQVFDRNGNMLADSPNGWDGKIDGDYAQPGVYFYVATLSDGSTHRATVEIYAPK